MKINASAHSEEGAPSFENTSDSGAPGAALYRRKSTRVAHDKNSGAFVAGGMKVASFAATLHRRDCLNVCMTALTQTTPGANGTLLQGLDAGKTVSQRLELRERVSHQIQRSNVHDGYLSPHR